MADSEQSKKDQTSPPVEAANAVASSAPVAATPAPAPAPIVDDENRLSVYVYQSKLTQPACIKSLAENLSKQKEAGTLGFNFHATESAGALTARLTTKGYGIAVISVHDEKEMQQAHLVLGKLSGGINSGLIRVLIVNKFNEPKTLQNLKVRGAYEILDFGMNVKSLTFKMNNAIKLTESQYNRSNSNKSKTSSIQDAMKAAKKSRADNSCATVHEKSDEHAADFWILTSENHVRYVMGRVVVELLGPGPASGHWTRTESVRNDEQGWMWNPRQTEDTPFFSSAQGRWIFFGRQPDFSWQSHLWNFVSKAPFLAFYQDGVPEPVTVRFHKESSTQFKIKKNVAQAQQWMALIKETIDAALKQKDSLIAEKAASDYRMKAADGGPSARAKDFVDHGDPESKELSGKFGEEKSDTGAEDYLNKAADESKELGIALKDEKPREMRNRTSQNPEKKSAFNPLNESAPKAEGAQRDVDESELEATPSEAREKPKNQNSKQPAAKVARTADARSDSKSHAGADVESESDEDQVDAPDLTSEEESVEPMTAAQVKAQKRAKEAEKRAEAIAERQAQAEAKKNQGYSRSPSLGGEVKKKEAAKEIAKEGDAQALHVDSDLPGKKSESAAKPEDREAAKRDAKPQPVSGFNAAREEKKKKIAEIASKKAAGTPLSPIEAKTLEDAESEAETEESAEQAAGLVTSKQPQAAADVEQHEKKKEEAKPGREKSAKATTAEDEKSIETRAHTSKEEALPEVKKHDLTPDAPKGAFNVGNLSADEAKNIGRKSATNSHFEIYLIGKNGSPLPKPLALQLIEIGEVTLLADVPGVRFGVGESAQIRVRYECEPEMISFDAATEVKSFDESDEPGSALATLAMDSKSILKMNQIADALATRRELMTDFFRMARGEDTDEQLEESQKAA